MTELYERIPIENLTLLRKMTVDDYIRFANKTKYKLTEIKEHYNQIMDYVKAHIKCKGVMKKYINTASRLTMVDYMACLLFKTWMELLGVFIWFYYYGL